MRENRPEFQTSSSEKGMPQGACQCAEAHNWEFVCLSGSFVILFTVILKIFLLKEVIGPSWNHGVTHLLYL